MSPRNGGAAPDSTPEAAENPSHSITGHRKTRASSVPDGISFAVPKLADNFARHVDGTFIVVVEMPGEKYRRRAFLTVASAQRAARNAQARGHNCRVYLAELKPLFWLAGGDER